MDKTSKKKMRRIRKLISTGRKEEALKALGVKDIDSLMAMGYKAFEEDDHDKAEEVFSHVLLLEPDNVQA